MRFLAVDWSGSADLRGQRQRIWTAGASDEGFVSLEKGRSRDEVVAELVEVSDREARLVVGLDFSFSFPAWFVLDQGCKSVEEFWEVAETCGERWLAECLPPFWGRRGTKKVRSYELLRRTEASCTPVGPTRPKSVFQTSGPGVVGPGSIRGMSCLRKLQEAGFSIWPFHPPAFPLVVEIYPRAFTGPVVKSDPSARRRYLSRIALSPGLLELAASSEDAFDSLISCLAMSEHATELCALDATSNPTTLLEGEIWRPSPTRREQAPA
jgi:hypothetical protein